MQKSKSKIAGWALSGLLLLFFLFSASGKFLDFPGKEEMFAKLGLTDKTALAIGITEVLCVILFLIPRTAFLGAIVLTAYLGGATFAHVRGGDPFFAPPVVGILVWIALGLRQPAIFQMAMGKDVRTGDAPSRP